MEQYIKFAEEYISNRIGDDCGLVKESVTDYGDVVYFYFQSKKYLKTKNFRDMYVGQGPMFIIKSDNRVISFGSAFWKEAALENMRKFIDVEKEIRLDYPSFDCFSNHLNLTLKNESKEESLVYIRKQLSNQVL